MELTRTKIIIYAVIGLIALGIIALFLSMKEDGAQQQDDNILSHQAQERPYDTDNRDKPGNRERDYQTSPLQGSHTNEENGREYYGQADPRTLSADRHMNSIPDMGMMGEDELDRIQREIEEENRAYSRRQQQREDSLRQANVNQGVKSLTGKDVDDETESTPRKMDTQKVKSRKTKGTAEKPAEPVASSAGRFSDVTIHKTAKTNAIKAFVHSQQVVRQGSTLKMRVAEDCLTDDGHLLPKNSFVYGQVKKIDGERVDVEITNVNVNGNILPFNKIVYSSDAQRGIRVTNTAKSEAAKEVGGDAVDATAVNTGVSSPGLIGAGVGVVQGAVQGTKRALSKNIKDVKVTIKTNYELLFMEPDDSGSGDDSEY